MRASRTCSKPRAWRRSELMRLVYFDECKYHPPSQEHYWIGAVSIDSNDLPWVEKSVNDLSREYFGTQNLSIETEFHAKDIFHRKRHFRDWSEISKRLECLQRLATLVGSDKIRRIYIRISPALMMRNKGWEDAVFMYLVEKIQVDTAALNDHAIMIGDLDGQFSNASVFNLSRFREQGTDCKFGRKIDRVLESVYFIPSHHSRMLQLADIYTWCLQLCEGNDDGNYPRSKMRSFVRLQTDRLRSHRYKEWPSNLGWNSSAKAA